MEATQIKTNLQAVHRRIREACSRVSRNPEVISLVIVAKYSEPEAIQTVLKFEPHPIVGESRVQDVIRKFKFFSNHRPISKNAIEQVSRPDNANGLEVQQKLPINDLFYLHFIGHLQTNKVKALLPYLDLLQSLDRLSLATTLEQALAKLGRVLPCFIQLNLSEDATRFGFTPETIRAALPTFAKMKHIAFSGLMTMAPFVSDQRLIRSCFKDLKVIKAELSEIALKRGYKNIQLKELSMGMSQDFEVALEEGATYIRLGSAIFK